LPLAEKVNVTLALWLLVIVTVLLALLVPTGTVPKDKVAGESVTGVSPVPDKLITWRELLALSLRVTAPEIVPAAVGEKVTKMVQELDGAKLVPQVSISE